LLGREGVPAQTFVVFLISSAGNLFLVLEVLNFGRMIIFDAIIPSE